MEDNISPGHLIKIGRGCPVDKKLSVNIQFCKSNYLGIRAILKKFEKGHQLINLLISNSPSCRTARVI